MTNNNIHNQKDTTCNELKTINKTKISMQSGKLFINLDEENKIYEIGHDFMLDFSSEDNSGYLPLI